MNSRITTVLFRSIIPLGLVLALAAGTGPALANSVPDIPDDVRAGLGTAVGAWVKEQGEGSENEHGKKTKRGYFSRYYEAADDGTYHATAHVETAGELTKTTERYLLTLKQEGGKWSITNTELKDSYAGMHRESGTRCGPFQRFSFDREGVKLNATNGTACASFYQDSISYFAVHADDATYSFAPPEHAMALHTMPDFHSLYEAMKGDHTRELDFKPAAFLFNCDPATCDSLIDELFVGYEPGAPPKNYIGYSAEMTASRYGWAKPLFEQWDKERRDSAFAHFREPYREGRQTYGIFIPRAIDPFTYPGFEQGLFDLDGSLPGPGVLLVYDNWAGFEVSFNVFPRRLDDPEQLGPGTLYGYYSEETLKNTDPYSIERRDDGGARWHEVYSVKGNVDLGIKDPEILEADIVFGIELKQDLRVLPFFIQSIPSRDFTGDNKPRHLLVNAVQLDGEELTWTRTSQLGGLVILPEKMPAGTRLNLRMNFETRALKKWTYSFTEVNRFGWMPFVRFGDFIDEFELTLRNPGEYKILGIGKKITEKKEGDVTVTHWKANSPVVFPSITFGRYHADTAGPKFEPATKFDGTPIPVTVHIDEASMQDWDITGDALRPIAQQAVNSINLYREVSGLDYPYGELNFVNDPRGFLYGQAPSSLIYLGQGVFRGEGFLAPIIQSPERIAKFLKSVVAHEVGHQWWGSRVSNANQRNYWFVETLAEYFSAIYLEQVYGSKEYEEQVEEWRRTILDQELMASVQNASAIWSGGGFGTYQAAVYNKGPFAFHMLRETFGDEKFFPFLTQFSKDLAEKREIVTLDIQQAAESALGGIGPDGQKYNVDLSWFFDQWIRSSGIPQYRFVYDVRQTEDGGWLVEGTIHQRVVVGSGRSHKVMENQFYRGVVDITVTAKGGDYQRRVVIDGLETPFKLKVPKKPLEVALNKGNEMLSLDVIDNKSWQ